VRNQWWPNAKFALGQVIIFPLTVPIVDLRLSDRYTNIAEADIDLTIRMGELEDFEINLTPIISN
jgi:hypothetical protein